MGKDVMISHKPLPTKANRPAGTTAKTAKPRGKKKSSGSGSGSNKVGKKYLVCAVVANGRKLSAEERVNATLVELHQLFGKQALDKELFANLSGFGSWDTKSYRSIISEHKKRGIIEKDALTLTDQGIQYLGLLSSGNGHDGDENKNKLERIKAFLVGKARTMVELLSDARHGGNGKSVVTKTKSEILDGLGLRSADNKEFRAANKTLKELGILQVTGDKYALMDRCFSW